jgi:cytochrome c oxidase subunit 4
MSSSSQEPAYKSREVTATQNLIVYGVLVAATVGNYFLAQAPLGNWRLPALLVVALIETVVGALFYMHLVEQSPSLRFVLPLAMAWVVLLMGFTLLDVITRYPPANAPGAPRQELPPERPRLIRGNQK